MKITCILDKNSQIKTKKSFKRKNLLLNLKITAHIHILPLINYKIKEKMYKMSNVFSFT
jgi:hypothetical protein